MYFSPRHVENVSQVLSIQNHQHDSLASSVLSSREVSQHVDGSVTLSLRQAAQVHRRPGRPVYPRAGPADQAVRAAR